MNPTPFTKDPVCGMTVNESFAIQAERNGKKYYFCGEGCKEKFLSSGQQAPKEEKKKKT